MQLEVMNISMLAPPGRKERVKLHLYSRWWITNADWPGFLPGRGQVAQVEPHQLMELRDERGGEEERGEG